MANLYPNEKSHSHPENGMTLADMAATLAVARRRNEIIMFRSTGPWSRRWIERGHPTKPFHVKGKSSDWGPQSGFVPWRGIYSKVGYDKGAAEKGDKLNKEGIDHGFAKRVELCLTEEELLRQWKDPEGTTARTPIHAASQGSWRAHPKDWVVWADRAGKEGAPQRFAFWARWEHNKKGAFTIFVFPPEMGMKSASELEHHRWQAELLEVMGTAEEVVSDGVTISTDLPLTGDYDLFAIGPSFGTYGPEDKKLDNTLDNPEYKAALLKAKERAQDALRKGDPKALTAVGTYVGLKSNLGVEDAHKGNVTPRILEVIDDLNLEMAVVREHLGRKPDNAEAARRYLEDPATDLLGWHKILQRTDNTTKAREYLRRRHFLFRRVHHNAESGRPFVEAKDFKDNFPVTAFQPSSKLGDQPDYHANVLTFEKEEQVRDYFKAMYLAGYVLPKNKAWGMTSFLTDRPETKEFATKHAELMARKS